MCLGLQGRVAVAVAPTPNTAPTAPTVRPLSWAFAAGLITISVAAVSLARNIFHASRKLPRQGKANLEVPLSPREEAAVASVGPLLLAAETAAGIDETVHLSLEDLEKLDLNLRMLITNMDAQLEELQEDLTGRLPAASAAAWDTVLLEISALEDQIAGLEQGSEAAAVLESKLGELQWEVFGILQPHASDETKRSYRSLLYNRGVQAQLLRQVERQLGLRAKMTQVQAQLTALEGSTAGTSSSLRLAVAGCAIPHPKKAEIGGEDAFFALPELNAFGVADGVGGWAAAGVDPSEYPRKLITACESAALLHADPLDILTRAFREAHAPGSCTIALGRLDGDFLRVASLGDCGTRVVRGGRVIFASEVQEHRFNQPYQLSSPQYHLGNVPEDAQRYSLAVQPGDVIIMGSDGLWDNLWDHELEELIAEEVGTLVEPVGVGTGDEEEEEGAIEAAAEEGPSTSLMALRNQRVQELAERLAGVAAAHARDVGYGSPFAAERHEKMVPELLRDVVQPRGGKLDDVTAVAAMVY